MIIKRKPKPVRAIVKRRGTAVVGQKRAGTIVRRVRGSGVVPPTGNTPRPPREWHFRKRWLWLGGAIATLVVLFAGGGWLYESSVFRVTEIQVVGAKRTSSESVVETANLLGESMFDANLVQAQKDLYKLPLVASVKVERAWPNSIKVTLQERQAWGTWQQGGVDYTIDREGVVLALGSAGQDVPLIRSSEPGSRQQGDRVDYQAVDAAAEIYDKLPRQLGTTVKDVSFEAGMGVRVTTADNQTALFGDSSSISYKLAVWAAMAQQARVQRINYTTVDLRYGNRPVLQ
jgi:cell division protein FtsQ